MDDIKINKKVYTNPFDKKTNEDLWTIAKAINSLHVYLNEQEDVLYQDEAIKFSKLNHDLRIVSDALSIVMQNNNIGSHYFSRQESYKSNNSFKTSYCFHYDDNFKQ